MEMYDKKTPMVFLNRFLADNSDLEELSARLSEFNVFRALEIENAEIRHSNVLAWLLAPSETHGLSDIILRRVLSNILLLSNRTIMGVSPAQIELMEFSDIEVSREWRNIDVLVVDRTNRLVLFFENKIYSGESVGQLAKYKHIVKEEFKDYIIIPVFLTLTGHESDCAVAEDYICYSHIQLLSVLEKIYLQRKTQLTEAVQMFICHYLDTLRRLTMQDQDLMNLCKTIYRKHREAIDMIVEFGKASVFVQAMQDLLEKSGEFEILYSSSAYVWFLPKSWAKWVPENGVAWTSLARPVSVCCWIEDWQDSFSSHFEVSKMLDPELRLKLVFALKDAGFKLSSKAFNKDATYSRFYGRNAKNINKADYDEVYSCLENVIEKMKIEYPKVEAVLRQVFAAKG